MKRLALACITCSALSSFAYAQDVRITEGAASVMFMKSGRQHFVEREQDTNMTLTGPYALVARPCPSDCVQPISAHKDVATYGELEVIEFLKRYVANDTGLVVDARLPDEYNGGHIPAAVNIPALTLSAENPYLDELMTALGGTPVDDTKWEFPAKSNHLLLLGHGAWDGKVVDAINMLINAGYPTDKLGYYRGGMQSWLSLGFKTASNE